MDNNVSTADEDDSFINDSESNAGLDPADAGFKKSKMKKDKGSKKGGEKSVSVIDVYVKKAVILLSLFKMIPFVLLGDKMKAKKAKYVNLQLQLKQARMPISYEMYLSNAIFYSIVGGIVGAILGLF
ncbi:MAG: secretion system protein, partial [Methanosarcinaceae archaeon]|nr:secretion system protein [Methanosarcinaceae archaeon]